MDVDTDLIVAAWHEWEIEGSDRRIVLCVETPLELRPGHDGFDLNAPDGQWEAAYQKTLEGAKTLGQQYTGLAWFPGPYTEEYFKAAQVDLDTDQVGVDAVQGAAERLRVGALDDADAGIALDRLAEIFR